MTNEKEKRQYDLQDRLIDLVVRILSVGRD